MNGVPAFLFSPGRGIAYVGADRTPSASHIRFGGGWPAGGCCPPSVWCGCFVRGQATPDSLACRPTAVRPAPTYTAQPSAHSGWPNIVCILICMQKIAQQDNAGYRTAIRDRHHFPVPHFRVQVNHLSENGACPEWREIKPRIAISRAAHREAGSSDRTPLAGVF